MTRVIDGDTLDLDGGERVRLIGVDCPELHEPLGLAAAEFVRELVEGREVRLSYDRATGRRDRFRRTLAYVWLPNGWLLNREVLHAGYATVDCRYPCLWTPGFLMTARRARRQGRGVWRRGGEEHACMRRVAEFGRGRKLTSAA